MVVDGDLVWLAGPEGRRSGVASFTAARTAVRLLLKLLKNVVDGKVRLLAGGPQGPHGRQDGLPMLVAHGAEAAINMEMRCRVSPAVAAVVVCC